jgi:hypothetical protein
MSANRPCSDPQNSPNDWFISRDGKQYPDDDFLSESEIRGISKSVLPIEGETAEDHRDRVEAALTVASAERRRTSLIARRHARDKCHTECYFRTACLGRALDEHQDHGTWGGYYEEELRELRKAIASRRKKRNTPTPE